MQTRNIAFIKAEEKSQAHKMLLEYLKELSEFDDTIEFDQKENAIYKWFDYYWIETDKRFSFWFMIENKIVGFGFVRVLKKNFYEVAEFYIKPKFRGNDNAISFMDMLFEKYKGKWNIGTRNKNVRAVKFWTKYCKKHSVLEIIQNTETITWIIK